MWRLILNCSCRVAMMYPKHVSLLLAVATVASVRPSTTAAEVAVQQQASETKERKKCPFYGCPLLPRDIHYDEAVRSALEAIRTQKREQLSDTSSLSSESSQELEDSMSLLDGSGDADMATLTLIGYKGGRLATQINQDRAFAVSPFHVSAKTDDEFDEQAFDADERNERRLLGVFDGHAPLGEVVSEYTVTELPKLLSSKLDAALPKVQSKEEEEIVTKLALVETFVEMDKTAPAEVSGGCTASVVLQMGPKLYVANAGDSQSFVVVYHKSTSVVEVVYKSREDKPHLPDERARVEKAGGSVYIPPRKGGTSRVLYIDPVTGNQNGLAMSRSIGDWEVGKFGVIPDPIVDVIDIPELVVAQLASVSSCVVMDEYGEIMDVCTPEERSEQSEDDVHIFAVSATDGMMDYLTAEVIAKTLASSLFDEDGPHPLSACEQLISTAAAGWYHAKQGRYRDDIAIAVSKIRTPPS